MSLNNIDVLKSVGLRIKADLEQFHSLIARDFNLEGVGVRISTTVFLTQYQLIDCNLTYSFPNCQDDDDHISLTIGFFQKREVDSLGAVTYRNDLEFAEQDVVLGNRLYITSGIYSAVGKPLIENEDLEIRNLGPKQLLDQIENSLEKIFSVFKGRRDFLGHILRNRRNCA